MLFDDEYLEEASAARASPVAKALRSEHARAKDASKMADDGSPLWLRQLAASERRLRPSSSGAAVLRKPVCADFQCHSRTLVARVEVREAGSIRQPASHPWA